MKGVMIQGTASDVGKSLIATALCRLFANEGFKTAPFKSQNMSNNSYVTMDGLEIGRAQGLQAEAAKTEASVWMNPILLKPRSDQLSEVVLLGKAVETLSGKGYRDRFYNLGLSVLRQSLDHLGRAYDVLIMEGAGSPVEINLKDRELVNMKVAEMADVPVFLVADIDRGGVFASIIGTLALLTESERQRVQGLIINKFRGDFDLFADGISWLEEKTNISVLGVLPYINDHMIDGEDSLSIQQYRNKKMSGDIDIAVIELPYASNINDIEPFFYEEDVALRFVRTADEFGRPDAVILPGTKSTIHDFISLKEKGLDKRIRAFVQNGGFIVGICGGYQMMGQTLVDDNGVDTGMVGKKERGLGLIDAVTFFQKEKQTIRSQGTYHPQTGLPKKRIVGYEIHLGRTDFLQQNKRPFFLFDSNREEGYYGENGKIIGTYLHHLFYNDDWRTTWLNAIRASKQLPIREKVNIGSLKDEHYEQLANTVRNHLDWKKVKNIVLTWENHHEDH